DWTKPGNHWGTPCCAYLWWNDMAILHSTLRGSPEDVRANRSAYEALRAHVKTVQAESVSGGGHKYVKTHLERNKSMPRDRVNELLDPGTPFLEIGHLAGNKLYDDSVPSAGIIVGVGMVQGQPCMV